MDANSNSKSPSTAKIVDHVVSIATPQSNVDVKMATQKRYNRKSWMQAIKCISGVLMFIFLILLVCASYVELERKISKNESQINLCLQKIQKLSRDNRRLKLQVRRLETETKFPGIVKKTSPEETLTFREEGLQTAKVGGSDTDQSSPSSSSQLQFPFLERNTKPLIRNKRRGGKKGSKGSKGKKKKCKGQTTDDQRDKRALSVKPWFRMTGLPNTRPGDALKDTPAGTVFQWTPENPEDLSRFGRKPRISAAVHTVVILCPGVYDVYADIRLNGRLNLDNVMKPYVGIDLIRKRQTRDPWDVLTSGYITQANMGINDEYFGDDGRPMDTLSVRGKFAFQCGDEVRIRLTPGILSYSPYTDVFMLDGNQAQFEMAIYERHNTYCPQCN